jgi:hypothetical protein
MDQPINTYTQDRARLLFLRILIAIYDEGAPLGSSAYFEVRKLAQQGEEITRDPRAPGLLCSHCTLRESCVKTAYFPRCEQGVA